MVVSVILLAPRLLNLPSLTSTYAEYLYLPRLRQIGRNHLIHDIIFIIALQESLANPSCATHKYHKIEMGLLQEQCYIVNLQPIFAPTAT